MEQIKYEEWIKYRIESNELPMTRTQSLLAKEIFQHQELVKMLSQPGDLITIVNSIQKYLKK